MSSYQVDWASSAIDELKSIVSYISRNDPEIAVKKYKEIRTKAGNLLSYPEKGRVVPELKAYGITSYRELIIPPWRLIYSVLKPKIIVISIFDSRRNIEDQLFDRLLTI